MQWRLCQAMSPSLTIVLSSVSISILRSMFVQTYLSSLPRSTSSDPYPHDTTAASAQSDSTEINESIFANRSRETGVFDRFIANRVGEDLRRVESELYEESEAEMDIIRRLQVGLGAIARFRGPHAG